MKEKKNIDKLFKERFKDFEQAPSDAVWQGIEEELHKDKRKRRIIPIWWKFAGVAAVLALLFTVANVLNNTNVDSSVEQQVVETETNTEESKIINESSSEKKVIESTNPEAELSTDIKNNSTIAHDDNASEKQLQPLSSHQVSATNNENDKKVASTKSNSAPYKLNSSNKNKQQLQVKDAVVISTHKDNEKEENGLTNRINDNSNTTNTVVNANQNDQSKSKVNTSQKSKEESEIDKLLKDLKQSKDTQVTSSNTSEKDINATNVDSTKTKDLLKEENAIEKAIAEAQKEDEETKEEEEANMRRWSVAPNIAPVYFNTLGEGSSIDNQFIENTKEGNVNVSYGLKGSYAINEKLKIRAGINKVDLGYSTNNVLVFDSGNPTTGARQMQNVQLHDTLNTAYVSASTLSLSNGPEILNAKERGSIEQQLGFIEVPVELEYSLVDKKFGLNLIGGFSTLFLNNNEIYSVESNGNRTLMGEATNIKDMSYSANFGVGVNYNISEQLRFNLEPTFKYQINTFNNTSGDFRPFFIGVYTGLSFKF